MLNRLELKVPPPLVALICAGVAWLASRSASPTALSWPWVWAAVVVAGLGLAVALLGVAQFRRARTTVSPLSPHKSTQLVSTGIYRFTRNPMYVGMALVLVAVALGLRSGAALVGCACFVAYITRFQIIPEERVLQGLFGASYTDYRTKVRRWI